MSWRAGQRIDSASLNRRGTLYVVKPSNTDRTSTVTPTADPHLTISLEPGLWEIEIGIHYSSDPAANGIRTAWIIPGGAVAESLRACTGPGQASTDRLSTQIRATGLATTSDATYGHGSGISSPAGANETALIRIATTGSVALSWAQQTSNAAATRLHSGAWLRAEWVEE